MATKIRLQRHGRKSYAFYSIVIADVRAPRDGKFIEKIGTYNPNTNPATVDLKFDRALDWVLKGAQPTDTVRNILSREGVYMKKHLQVGVRNKALSVDHLERMGAEEIEVLRTSGTMPTMLPGAAFFLEMPYPPARAMIEGGLSVALASDFNPGSSPSGSMKMIVSLACIKMRMTPAEAINAATLNGAYAMGLSSEYGSITVGKKANFFLTTKIPSVAYLPYAYTSLLIHRVFLRGQEVK